MSDEDYSTFARSIRRAGLKWERYITALIATTPEDFAALVLQMGPRDE